MASDAALDLLKSMLAFDPLNRLTATDALKHPYFNNMYEVFYNNFAVLLVFYTVGIKLWK